MSVYSWSTTAGTNASADAAINWAEGQLPSTVNDSARAMMAAVAAWIQDQGGYATTGGSSNAYTLTLSQTMLSKVPSLIAFSADRTNTGAATLNVDGTGAYPLRSVTGAALAAGDIVTGNIYLVTWVSGSSEWLLVNSAMFLKLTGGTMTGALTLSGAPTSNLHASTKKYVDDTKTTVDAYTVTAGTGLTGGGAINSSPTVSIASGGVGATQLASDAVTTVKITDANVTPAKLSQPVTRDTAKASTSGTTVDFTGIPSWARSITIMFQGVSTSSTGNILIQLGTSSGAVASGYLGGAETNGSSANSTAGLLIISGASSAVHHGIATWTNLTGNTWAGSATIARSDAASVSNSGSSIALSGTLDRVRITTTGGDFDAGNINIIYYG